VLGESLTRERGTVDEASVEKYRGGDRFYFASGPTSSWPFPSSASPPSHQISRAKAPSTHGGSTVGRSMHNATRAQVGCYRHRPESSHRPHHTRSSSSTRHGHNHNLDHLHHQRTASNGIFTSPQPQPRSPLPYRCGWTRRYIAFVSPQRHPHSRFSRIRHQTSRLPK
jgi:hypothetical protein